MACFYLGHLPQEDPLSGFLRREVFPLVGCDGSGGIRVFGTNGSNAVYIYEDRTTCKKVVGKFFYSSRTPDWEKAGLRLDREDRNIRRIRSLLGENHYVARVLGRNDGLNRLLVVEHCTGEGLDHLIIRAMTQGDPGLLKYKLGALADFLATVHNRSAENVKVDFDAPCRYLADILRQLGTLLSPGDAAWFLELKRRWHDDDCMWQDNSVLVHGDATPANFLFGDGMYVISFDMERVRRADRCFDTGRIAGELQHFAMMTLHDRGRSEEFISHFLWEYASRFPDRERAFYAIARRLPFYMGITLLRIARNTYHSWEYRRRLVEAAELCLRR